MAFYMDFYQTVKKKANLILHKLSQKIKKGITPYSVYEGLS